jgi:hypothetical protein
MKTSLLRIALLVSLAVVGFGREAEAAVKIESSPADDSIVLDGDPADWEGFPIAYLQDTLHVMAIAHDDSNIYVMYRFADQRLARQLLMRGVTLWINGDGKTKNKNEEFAVRYPGSEQIAEQFENEGSREERYRAETDGSDTFGGGGPPPPLASMHQVPGQLTVIRMGMKEAGDENGAAGPTAASSFNDGIFCYELKIPLADIGGKIADASPAKKRVVAIGVQIGGMTEAEMESMQAAMKEKMGGMSGHPPSGGMSGGPPSGMGGGGLGSMGGGMGGMGGGRGGGGMGGDGGDMGHRMEPEIEWLSVTLPPDD